MSTYPRPPIDDAEREACNFPYSMCGSRSGRFMCNRAEGHTGDHVAAGDDVVVARWPSTTGQPAEPTAPESAGRQGDLAADVLAAQAATLSPAGKQRRFEFVPAMFALYYPAMCETAREMGYALGLHGSMARDLDVVAVPWTDEAASPEELVARLVERHKFTLKQEDRQPAIREKPHGRRGWVMWFGGHFYVDLSVMPRVATNTAASPPPTACYCAVPHLTAGACPLHGASPPPVAAPSPPQPDATGAEVLAVIEEARMRLALTVEHVEIRKHLIAGNYLMRFQEAHRKLALAFFAVEAMARDHARLVEAAKELANYLRDHDLDDHTGEYWRRYEALRAALSKETP